MKNINTEEMLQVWDWETARPTEKKVTRAHAHQHGIPHEAVHLWLLKRKKSDTFLLFQHRASHKGTYPDCLDISVGGHVPYGLEGGKVAKEAREELGIDFDESRLHDLGWYRYVERSGKLFQRELQHIYLLCDNRPLNQYGFLDGEVSGLYSVPYNDFKEMLIRDRLIEIEGFNGRETVSRTVSRKDFHPQLFDASMELYMRYLVSAIDEFIETGTVSPGNLFKL
jgi:isopentenyldiphosphate isomerase